MKNFTEAQQANDDLEAAKLAAANLTVAPVAGVGNTFLHNHETTGKFIGAKEAVRMLQSMGGERNAEAAKALQTLITKSVGIGDIGAVRLVSLSTEISKVYNTNTVFLNLIEARRLNTVTDFTHGWREDDFSADSLDSMVFDPNGAPNESNGPQARRTNTLTAIGATVNVGIISNEMTKKRGFMDLLDSQTTDTLVKIKRSANRQLLQATENPSGPKFLMGGLVTRTVSNVVTPGSLADVTRVSLDAAINQIVTAVGVHELVIVAGASACGTINGFLQAQFPGGRVADFFTYNDPKARIATVYYSPLVGPVAVYLDTQMPANTLSIFAPEYVRPNGFTIGDMAGPFVIALAQTGLSEPKAIFDLMTLEDRVEKSRAKITNIN